MKEFYVQQGPLNKTGLLFSLNGFLLVILCLVGCLKPSSQGLYFAKVTDAVAPTNGSAVSVYYGWQGYCIQDTELNCFADRSIMVVPFDVSISNQLNSTYPRLFTNAISQDTNLNPDSAPSPAHDPRIYPAAILCVLCSSILLAFCLIRIVVPRRYQDQFYTRGFLSAGAAVLALLLIILSSVMYQNAIEQLNLDYPNLIASQGPAMTMIGVAFACFFVGSYCLLRGCMSMDSNTDDTEGYNPI